MAPIEIDDEQTVDAGDLDPLARPESTADLAPPRGPITRHDTPLPFAGEPPEPLPFVQDPARTPTPPPDFGRTMLSPGTPAVRLPPGIPLRSAAEIASASPADTSAAPTFAARFFPTAAPSQPVLARAETLPVLSLDEDRATVLLPSAQPATPRLAPVVDASPAPMPFAPAAFPEPPSIIEPPAPHVPAPALVGASRPDDAALSTAALPTALPAEPIELADEAVAILCALVDVESPAYLEVLASAGATHDDFVRSLDATTARIERALVDGDDALLAAFDDAYVTSLEGARAPIDLDRYVALVVAQERGRAFELLATWELPAAALARIHRVWQRRLFDDDTIAARFDDALERARG